MNLATSTSYDPRVGVASKVEGIPSSFCEIRDLQEMGFVFVEFGYWGREDIIEGRNTRSQPKRQDGCVFLSVVALSPTKAIHCSGASSMRTPSARWQK